MNDSERLDAIAGALTRPEQINAIHACREGHPLGRGNDWKWRSAAYIVRAAWWADISYENRRWIERKADEERAVTGWAAGPDDIAKARGEGRADG